MTVLWDVLEYLCVFDPKDVQMWYSPETIEMLAEDYDVVTEEVVDVCDSLQIKLPFGKESRLNQECFETVVEELNRRKNITVENGGELTQEEIERELEMNRRIMNV
eukprot:GHVU01199519.1.p4 GENE.GHVU01199519.1~~GHVU01199519.1.p4  ORF type:complete len:106 (+),score=24.88 GHVU01199519.1:2619-2936(+)